MKMTRLWIFVIIIAEVVLAGGFNLFAETNLVTATMVDYLPYVAYVGKVTNNVPTDAVAVLEELRASKVATPEVVERLVWQNLTKEERKLMASAFSRPPCAVHLWRNAATVNESIIAGDLVWVVQMSVGIRVLDENKRLFFIPARTGEIITPNQVPEDTARKLADPHR
jgi:hypothetical protein